MPRGASNCSWGSCLSLAGSSLHRADGHSGWMVAYVAGQECGRRPAGFPRSILGSHRSTRSRPAVCSQWRCPGYRPLTRRSRIGRSDGRGGGSTMSRWTPSRSVASGRTIRRRDGSRPVLTDETCAAQPVAPTGRKDHRANPSNGVVVARCRMRTAVMPAPIRRRCRPGRQQARAVKA
jgi:hypothetical protein